ncbi:MAG TPA: hypothetical protein VHD62_03930 [Opitutaceae bacterium]|nr:hypothetical protein [Opitutaceae bacterium]
MHLLLEFSVLEKNPETIVEDAQPLGMQIADEPKKSRFEFLLLRLREREKASIDDARHARDHRDVGRSEIVVFRGAVAEKDKFSAAIAPVAEDPESTGRLGIYFARQPREQLRIHSTTRKNRLEPMLRRQLQHRAAFGADAVAEENRPAFDGLAWRKDHGPRIQPELLEHPFQALLETAEVSLESQIEQGLVQRGDFEHVARNYAPPPPTKAEKEERRITPASQINAASAFSISN